MRKSHGFTLMEVLVSISILAIITAFAVPSFRTLMKNSALSSVTGEFVGDLNLARAEAITRRNSVTFTPTSTANWALGWQTTDSASVQLGARSRDNSGLTATVSPTTVAAIVFNRDGTVLGWTAPIVITICDDRSKETGRTLTISRLGQITNAQFTCT